MDTCREIYGSIGTIGSIVYMLLVVAMTENATSPTRLSLNAPSVRSVNDSSAVVQWVTFSNLKNDVTERHYNYVIEWGPVGASSRSFLKVLPVCNRSIYSDTTLTGLVYNTAYEVLVRRDDGVTDSIATKFRTMCTVPSPPRDVFVQDLSIDGDQTTLTVNWKHPQVIGCDVIDDYTIQYRQRSELDDDQWTVDDQPSGSTTSYTLTDLGVADYVVRVVVTNNGNFSNFAQTIFSSTQVVSDRPTLYIVVGVLGCVTVVSTVVACLFYLQRRKVKVTVVHKDAVPLEPPYEEISLGYDQNEAVRSRDNYRDIESDYLTLGVPENPYETTRGGTMERLGLSEAQYEELKKTYKSSLEYHFHTTVVAARSYTSTLEMAVESNTLS